MSRLKKGTELPFLDSEGVKIKIGDTLRGPLGIIRVWGTQVTLPSGKKCDLKDLPSKDYRVSVLTKLEESVETFSVGDVVSNGNTIGYYKSVTDSGASATIVCAYIRKSGVIKMSWVVPLNKLRKASFSEASELENEMYKRGLVFDKSTCQGLKSNSCFSVGDWVTLLGIRGIVSNVVGGVVGPQFQLAWTFDGSSVSSSNDYYRGGTLMTFKERIDLVRELNLAGYGLTPDWRVEELKNLLPAEVKSNINSLEITVKELSSITKVFKEAGTKGEFTFKVEI